MSDISLAVLIGVVAAMLGVWHVRQRHARRLTDAQQLAILAALRAPRSWMVMVTSA